MGRCLGLVNAMASIVLWPQVGICRFIFVAAPQVPSGKVH
jgi:hypothetical protein